MTTKRFVNKAWITENSKEVIARFSGLGTLTLKEIQNDLILKGMQDNIQNYQKLLNTMTQARWNDSLDASAFTTSEMAVLGDVKTKYVPTQKVNKKFETIQDAFLVFSVSQLVKWVDRIEPKEYSRVRAHLAGALGGATNKDIQDVMEALREVANALNDLYSVYEALKLNGGDIQWLNRVVKKDK